MFLRKPVSKQHLFSVTKWIDFFVLHKPIKPERITQRLK